MQTFTRMLATSWLSVKVIREQNEGNAGNRSRNAGNLGENVGNRGVNVGNQEIEKKKKEKTKLELP